MDRISNIAYIIQVYHLSVMSSNLTELSQSYFMTFFTSDFNIDIFSFER